MRSKKLTIVAVIAVFILTATPVSAFSITWTNDPTSCLPSGTQDMYNGQNCYPNANCGLNGSTLQCTDPTSIANPPAVNQNSSVIYSSGLAGGYLINCLAAADGANPYCDNSGNYWCNSDTTCLNTNHRQTQCNANLWAGASGAYTCSNECVSNYYDCNGGVDCERQNGSACTFLPGIEGTYQCTENLTGSCYSAISSGGSRYDCLCIPDKQYFETGSQANYSTSDPLLWGRQYGTGDLITMGNSSGESVFNVDNIGLITTSNSVANSLRIVFDDGAGKAGIYTVNSNPNGSISGLKGSLAMDYTNGRLYINSDGATAWSEIMSGAQDVTVGSMSGTSLFADATADGDWLGLGSAAGRIEFDDITVDEVNVLNARMGIGTSTPIARLHLVDDLSAGNTSQFLIDNHFENPETGFYARGAFSVSDLGNLSISASSYDGTFYNRNILLNPGGGNVGIGTDIASDFKLQVDGSIGPVSAPEYEVSPEMFSIIEENTLVGDASNIFINGDGLPAIVYNDGTNGTLKFVKCTSYDCSSFEAPITLATSGTDGSTAIAALVNNVGSSSDGFPIVSYFDETNDDLRVIKCNSLNCSTYTDNLLVESEAGYVAGKGLSMAIGQDAHPIIVFSRTRADSTGTHLFTYKCANNSCIPDVGDVITDIATIDDLYLKNAIAIGQDGNPIIVAKMTSDALHLIRCTNAECSATQTPVTIDNGLAGNAGFSIAITGDGLPVVSYTVNAQYDLWMFKCGVAACNSGNQNILLVDEATSVGWGNNVSINSDGYPIITSTHWTGGNSVLLLARCSDYDCSGGVAATYYEGGPFALSNVLGPSLMVNELDAPLVSFKVYYNDPFGFEPDYSTFGVYLPEHNSGFSGSDLGSSTKYFNDVYASQYYAKDSLSISNFDVAEDYTVEDVSISGGDVVLLSKEDPQVLIKSSEAYQPDVIGVISTSPGLRLTDWDIPEAEKDLVRPLALSGRVPVKVSNENGNIEIGDYLVTSSKPGVAMKQCGEKTCLSSMVIGRALEPFKGSDLKEGKILMFVDLGYRLTPSLEASLLTKTTNLGESSIVNGTTNSFDLGKFESIETRALNVMDLNVTGLINSVAITTDLIKPKTGDINLELNDAEGLSRFLITNSRGDYLFGIDSKGILEFGKSNPSRGQEVIPAGVKEYQVETEGVNKDSIILLTLISDLENAPSITLSSQGDGYFTVKLNSTASEDLTFNWWFSN